MTTQKFYSDAEMIDGLQIIAEKAYDEDVEMIQCAIERIKTKQRQIQFQGDRLRIAAEHIGFTMIDELYNHE